MSGSNTSWKVGKSPLLDGLSKDLRNIQAALLDASKKLKEDSEKARRGKSGA